MGRHSAPEENAEDGDVLVATPARAAERPRPRPRHAVPNAEIVSTDVIEPEIVERPAEDEDSRAAPRDVVDAVVVEDERFAVPRRRPDEPPPALVAPAVIQPAVVAPAPTAKERPGRSDLRLLRESSALRARCAAAVVVPFVMYTVVLLVIGALGSYAFWVWIPAVLAGVLFGAQLDLAARRKPAAGSDQGTSNPSVPAP